MAKSVSAVNVGVGFNIQEVMKNTGLARNQIQAFMRAVKAEMTDAEKFAKERDIGKKLLASGDIDEAGFEQAMAFYRQKYNIIDQGEQRIAEYNAHKQAMAKKEEDSMIFLMNVRKELQKSEEEAAKKKAEQIAAAKKAEEDAMMFMHRLKQTIDADNKARADARIARMLEENRIEVQGILRVERERANAQQLFLQQVTSERTAREQAERSIANQHWDNINSQISHEAQLIEQRRVAAQQQAEQARQARQAIVDQQRIAAQLQTETYRSATAHQSVAQAARNRLTIEQMLLGVTLQQADALQRRNTAMNFSANLHGPDLSGEGRRIRDEDNAARARNLDRVRGMLEAATTAQERYAQAVRFVQGMERWGNITREEAIRLIQRETLALNAATQAQQRISQVGAVVSSVIGSIGSQFAIAQIAVQAFNSAIGFVTSSLQTFVEYERAEASIEVLTGSIEEATKKMVEFRDLDRRTPLNFLDFTKAAKTLMGFGVETSKVTRYLENLAAISMGNSERFHSLALAFGQVAASGKLAGQEVLQMVNAGFNPLQQISAITGQTLAELRQATTDGKISFHEFAATIELATIEGERFGGMNEKLQNTIGGQMDKFNSDLLMAKKTLGESLVPLMSQLMGIAKDINLVGQDNQGGFLSAFLENAGLNLAGIRTYFHVLGNILNEYATGDAFKGHINEDYFFANSPYMQQQEAIEKMHRRREKLQAAGLKLQEDRIHELLKEADIINNLGIEEYKRYKIEEARRKGKEEQNRNAGKNARDAEAEEIDRINKEYANLGKTKQEIFAESIGFTKENMLNLSAEEQTARINANIRFMAIEKQGEEKRAIEEKVKSLIKERNENELLLMARRKQISYEEYAEARREIQENLKEQRLRKEKKDMDEKIERLVKQNNLVELHSMLLKKQIDQESYDKAHQKIVDQADKLVEKFNPAVKVKNDLQEIQNMLNANLIDPKTAEKAGVDIAKSIAGNIKQYQSPTAVRSFADAMLAAQRARGEDMHKKLVERYLKGILEELKKNPNAVIANFEG